MEDSAFMENIGNYHCQNNPAARGCAGPVEVAEQSYSTPYRSAKPHGSRYITSPGRTPSTHNAADLLDYREPAANS